MRRASRRIVAVVGVLSLTLAGCSPADITERIVERAVESQEGVEDVEIQIDEGDGRVVIEFKIEDVEGTVVDEIPDEKRAEQDTEGAIVIGGADIPADFPVPVPDGGTVASLFTMGDATGNWTMLQVTFPLDEYDHLKQFYSDWAEAADEGAMVFETFAPEPGITWTVGMGDYGATIALSQSDNETLLDVQVMTGG